MTLSRRKLLVSSSCAVAAVSLGGCQTGRRRRIEDVRDVTQVVSAQGSRDGAGVKLRRALGGSVLPMLDPFLLLDEIHSDDPRDYMAGFPSHPHRGFETVSYLIAGAFEHRDSVGNHGVIAAGGTQWMTAGRGIIHSEMPRALQGTELWGLQLWVNLPAVRKMSEPRYQDLEPSAILAVQAGDARVRVVAGALGKMVGPVDGVACEPTMLDVEMAAGSRFGHELPASQNAFLYMLSGKASVGPRDVPVNAGQLAVLGRGRDVAAHSAQGARFLVLAAAPIGEPVARRGPFVMNTRAELEQAFADYRSGQLAR